MICLNDLLQKAKDFNVPVTFADDIAFTGKVKNITDTVSMIRNALCHIPSKQHILGANNQRALEEVKINLAYLIVLASFSGLAGLQIPALAALSLPLNGQYDRYQ